jgi:hypothetical protein
MRKTSIFVASIVAAAMAATSASAGCYTKTAKATTDNEKDSKWYALETIVQAVDWGAWPGYVATGKPTGYVIKSQQYNCKPDGGQITCHARATLCDAK